jgi:hypothetical protein
LIDYLVRAETKEAWDAYALEQGWTVDHDGVVALAPGVLIDEIGPVVLEPAVIEDGEIVTDAVMDPWHHVNLRLLEEPADGMETRLSDARQVTTDPEGVDALEVGTEPQRVQVLDHHDIETPIRVWADGMHWTPVEAKPAAAAPKKAKKTKKGQRDG